MNKVNLTVLGDQKQFERLAPEQDVLAAILQGILSVGEPLRVVLYGSRARGDFGADSDYDVMVIEECEDTFQRERQYRDAVGLTSPPCSILVYTPRTVAEWRNVPGYITTVALAEGKVLYEDPAYPVTVRADGTLLVAEEELTPKTPVDLARAWFEEGDGDLKTCRLLIGAGGPYKLACFHAQQAVERYLKGMLVLHGATVDKTDDLLVLRARCERFLQLPPMDEAELKDLTEYGVQGRYDLYFHPEEDFAQERVDLARNLTEAILSCAPPEARPERKQS